jgi:hypothetical protein
MANNKQRLLYLPAGSGSKEVNMAEISEAISAINSSCSPTMKTNLPMVEQASRRQMWMQILLPAVACRPPR